MSCCRNTSSTRCPLFALGLEHCARNHVSDADCVRADRNLPNPFEIFRGQRVHVESRSFNLLRHFEVGPYPHLRGTILQGGQVELSRNQRGPNPRSINQPWRGEARASFGSDRANPTVGGLDINNPIAHKCNTLIHYYLQDFIIQLRPLHMQGREIDIERKASEPGRGDVMHVTAITHFQGDMPFSRLQSVTLPDGRETARAYPKDPELTNPATLPPAAEWR